MAGEWKEWTVAELQEVGALLVEDGNHGENRPRPDEFSTEGIQFIRAADMDSGRVLFESAQRINEVARKRVRKGIGAGGDALLSHKGTVGKVAYVPLDAPPFVCSPQTTFWRVKDPKQLDRRYIYFYLLSPAFREQLDSRKGETDMADYVSLTTQRTLKVTVPPLAEQKAIAAVLGALDDKIELNRRMNATLEAIVRALFQSWFVDFDPVRARLDGWPATGVDSATAALFPELLEDSPLGHIPKGWKVTNLEEIATNPRRGVQPRNIGPNTSYIALEHMPRRSIALGNWDDSAAVASNKLAFKKGEILFGKLRPYFHKVGVAPLDGVCSTDILVLAPKSPEWFGFLLGHASSDDLIQFTDLASTGTKMPRTNWMDIGSYKVALPPVSIADAFTKSVSPFICRINANLHESRVIAALRDALLPKLLRGEIAL